jgi:DNA-directed RNA polymerase specialized sigma subunit
MLTIKNYEEIKDIIEPVRNELQPLLDEREEILLDLYFKYQGDVSQISLELGIMASQTSRILRRIQFKAEKISV